MTSMQGESDVRRVRGLEIGHAAVAMVELERRGETTRVTSYRRVALSDRFAGEPDWPGAVARLVGEGEGPGVAGAAGVAIADEAVLYRSLTLPAAEASALEQMVRAQVEATLPGAGGGG